MISKSALSIFSVAGVGVTAVGGILEYKHFSDRDDSLLSKVKESLNNTTHKKILFSKDDEIWDSWKEFYGAETTPPVLGVSKEQLPRWCENSLAGKDEFRLALVLKWCVVNTRSVREELESKSKILLEGGADWGGAWETYNTGKGDQGILDSTFVSKNINEKTAGGPALKEWCDTYSSKKMYEFFEKGKSYEKVSKWCVKS